MDSHISDIYSDLHRTDGKSKTFDALEDISIGTRVLGHVQEKRLQTVIATSEPFFPHFIRDNRPEITVCMLLVLLCGH